MNTRVCSSCGKVYANRHNLSRHKKTCRSKMGSGLLYPTTSSSLMSGKHRLHRQESEDRSRLDSTKKLERESSSDSSNDGYDDDLTDITSIESEESDDDQEDDDTCDDINYVWYVMYQSCDVKNGEHFIEACAGYLGLYARSKDDVLFKSIMDDAARLEVDGMEFEKALASSILKHKLSIISKVNRCKLDNKDNDLDGESDDDNDELEIWCELSQKPVKPWCKWFTGETCNCKNCKSTCMLRMVAWYAYLFHFIEEDDLTMMISEKLEKCEDLYDELIPIVNKYRKDILAKYANVKDLVSKSTGDRLQSPKMLKLMFDYIDKNK